MTWDNAELNCIQMGGHLASIHSAAEDTELNNFNSQYPWFGFNDKATEGTFVWSDGSTVDYINWNTGQPDDYSVGEDCTNFHPESTAGKWNDLQCSILLQSFCRFSEGARSSPPTLNDLYVTSISSTTLNISWSLSNKSYSWIITHYQLTYYGIDVDTSERSISTSNLQYIITNLEAYTDYVIEVVAVNSNYTSQTYLIVRTAESAPSGPPLNVTLSYIGAQVATIAWLPPATVHQNGIITHYQLVLTNTYASVVVDTFTVSLGYTSHTLHHLIYNTNYSLSIFAATTMGSGPTTILSFATEQVLFEHCQSCDLILNGDCVVYVATPMNWDNAELNCIQMGGHLASIHSAAENTELNNFNSQYPWSGFNDKATEGTFVWSDGSTVDYINWSSGEPNNNGGEDCTIFKTSAGQWNDLSCINLIPSFCRISGSHSSPPTDLSVTSISSTTLNVLWSFPNEACTWKITHYQLTYYGIDVDTSERSLSTSNLQYNITNLEAYTDYVIEVVAANSNYTSQASSLIVRTVESAPSGPPLNVTLSYISTQVATIAWLPPAAVHQNGIITHYQLALTNTDASVLVDTVTVSLGYTSHAWYHLIYNTNYSLEILAATTAGSGPSTTLSFTTEQVLFEQCQSCDLILNGDCVVYVTTPMNWDNAELNCIQMGGHLASIHSAAENTELNNLRTIPQYPWFGFNDKATDGTFVWSDGYTVDYINWNPGEPNNAGGADCTHFFKSTVGQWNDFPCSRLNPSFCRFSGVHSSPPNDLSVTSISSTTLNLLWSLPNDTCSWKITHYQMTYYGIDVDASERSISTSNLQYILTNLEAYTDYVIEVVAANSNYNSQANAVQVRTAESAPSGPPLNVTLSYISTQVATIAWLPPAAVHQNGIITHYQLALTNTDTSVLVDTFTVSLGYTSHTWYHLIYNTRYSLAILAATTAGSGPTTTLSFTTDQVLFEQCQSCDLILNGDCIVYVSTPMNWDNAEVNCIQMGSHLASIHSIAENTELNNLRTISQYPWFGFNDKATEGTFVWSDGSTVDYINWNPGEPNNTGGEDCAHFYKSTVGQWNDFTCSRLNPSFCRFSGAHSAPPTDLSVTSISSTTVNVKWSLPSDTCTWKITHYQLTYYGIDIDNSERSITTINLQFELTNLEAYTDYIIVVVAANSNYTSQAAYVHVKTVESAPSGPPLNVTLSYISTQVATIAWLPPAAVHQNGIITHYQLALTNTDASVTVDTVTVSSGYTSHTWTNLDYITNYTVSVYVTNSFGTGPQALLSFSTIKPEISYILNSVPAVSTYSFDGIVLTLSISWTESKEVCYPTQYSISISYDGTILRSIVVAQSPVHLALYIMHLQPQAESYTFNVELCETATGICARQSEFEWTIPQTTLSTIPLPSTLGLLTNTTPTSSLAHTSSNILNNLSDNSLAIAIIIASFIVCFMLVTLIIVLVCIMKRRRKSRRSLEIVSNRRLATNLSEPLYRNPILTESQDPTQNAFINPLYTETLKINNQYGVTAINDTIQPAIEDSTILQNINSEDSALD